MCRVAAFTAAVLLGPTAFASPVSCIDDPRVAGAWRVLRTLNCERCHGKDYDGLAAPSILAYARTQSPEGFMRALLEGDPPRGMPGYRANPLGGGTQYHKGVDFEADIGDPVLAVADGVVTFSGVRSGYGNVVEIDHGNGYVTRYAHNSLNVGQVGDLVRRGQEIAKAGSTGRSTGAHVHFEVWENGVSVNPHQFLGEVAAPAARAQTKG